MARYDKEKCAHCDGTGRCDGHWGSCDSCTKAAGQRGGLFSGNPYVKCAVCGGKGFVSRKVSD